MSTLEDGLFGGGNVLDNIGTPAGANFINGGSLNDSAAAVLQKNFSSAFVGPNWTALLNALATGDAYVASTNQSIFDQAFLASASYPYLIDRASDIGITYPTNVGLTDDDFRQFALRVNANKLTSNALLDILNSFYGDYLTRASLTSVNAQPYALYSQTKPTISFIIDGVPVDVQFFPTDFTNNGAVSAEDIAQAINRYFVYNNLPATACSLYEPDNGNTYLRIYSGSLGLAGNVACTGGSAQDVIQFPQFLPDTADSTTTWNVAYSPMTSGNARYSYNSGTNPDVWSVARVGDYVNIYAPFGSTQAFLPANQGTFQIVAVGVNYFEVYNPNMAIQTGVATGTGIVNTINFYRPTKFTIFSNPIYAALDLSTKNVLKVYLPALSPIVARDRPLGSYWVTPNQTTIPSTTLDNLFIDVVTVNSGSTVTLTSTSSTSGISIGQYLFLASENIINGGTIVGNNPLGDGLYGPVTGTGTNTVTFAYTGPLSIGSHSSDLVLTTTNIGRDSSGHVWLNAGSNVDLFQVGQWIILDGVIPDTPTTVGTVSSVTVTVGSNGQALDALTGGILHVTTTSGFISAGTGQVQTSLGPQYFNYTGITSNSFTGVTSASAGTVSTGFSVFSMVTSVSSGKINGNYKISSITGDIVELATDVTTEMTASGGASITFMAAPLENGIPGPYMYDTNIDLADISATITNISTTVLQELRKGFSYTMVPVANPSQFPNAPGYLVFNFGSDNQVATVPYIGSFTNISGGGYLLFNATYAFPADVAINSGVIYSGTQKGAFVPSNPPVLNTLYLTDSPSGRAACEDAILNNSAAGFLDQIYIKWPNIFGVGNWASPFYLNKPALGGGGKINDAVRIFAENIDEDVFNAVNFNTPEIIDMAV